MGDTSETRKSIARNREGSSPPSRPQFQPHSSGAIGPKPPKRPKFIERDESVELSPRRAYNMKAITESRIQRDKSRANEDLDEDSIGIQDFKNSDIAGFQIVNTFSDNFRAKSGPQTGIAENDKTSEFNDIPSTISENDHDLDHVEPSEQIMSTPSIVHPTNSTTSTTHLSGSIFDTQNYHRVSLPLDWAHSQKCLIDYLRSEQNSAALSLYDFLSSHNVNLRSNDVFSNWQPQFEHALAVYIIAPRGTHAMDPSQMPNSHISLSSQRCSTEEFLYKLWKTLRARNEPTYFNEEVHTGPWHSLATMIGREWVTFILLHFHVFRPLHHFPGHWLQLAGMLRLDMSERQYGRRSGLYAERAYISKSDIMYRKRNVTNSSFERINPDDAASYHSELWALMLKTQKRVDQFQKVVGLKRIALPGPRSQQHKWTSHSEVVTFLTYRLKKILPLRVLGSKGNHKSFYKSLAIFVKSPGFSRISVMSLMKGIRLNEVPWLKRHDSANFDENQRHMAKCLAWLFTFVVKPLLLNYFYITEMSGKPGSIYYYEQTLWKNQVEGPARRQLIGQDGGMTDESNIREERSEAASASFEKINEVKTNQERGESWRIVPKSDGTSRPIINLKDFNKTIKDAHFVLQHTMKRSVSRLDSWHSWVTRLYRYRDEMTYPGKEMPRFHIVKVDVSGCYENANIEKVKQLVGNKLKNGRNLYRIQTVKRYGLQNRKLQIRNQVTTLPERQSTYQGPVLRESQPTSQDNRENPTSIVAETSDVRIVEGKDIISDISRLLDELRIKISNGKSIEFKRGIPQGSACSLDLCNILLDDLVDNRLKKFTEDPCSILLRYVDDFLFVSTDISLASEFREIMLHGFKEEYGVICNPKKVVATALNQERHRTVQFLGNNLETKTLDLHPRRIPISFRPKTCNLQVVKRKIDNEMETLLSALRSFARAGSPAPKKLLNDTASSFGASLVERIDMFSKIYNSKEPLALGQVYQRLLGKYFMRLIPKPEKKRINTLIKKSYIRQLKYQRKVSEH